MNAPVPKTESHGPAVHHPIARYRCPMANCFTVLVFFRRRKCDRHFISPPRNEMAMKFTVPAASNAYRTTMVHQ
jgi:hypothetical protein